MWIISQSSLVINSYWTGLSANPIAELEGLFNEGNASELEISAGTEEKGTQGSHMMNVWTNWL